jgi:hypothetical protein
MTRAPSALLPLMTLAMLAGGLGAAGSGSAWAQTVTIGIGTQDTTTNTVTTGVVIRELKLLEKYLPKDGKSVGLPALARICWSLCLPPYNAGFLLRGFARV